MSSARTRALRWIATSVAAGLAVLTLGSLPASAAVEPLPGTATTKFMSGWLPYWYGNAEIDRLVAHTGSDGIVGEVNLFWGYTAYRGNEIQAPLCVHDPNNSDSTAAQRLIKRSRECPKPTLTSRQKAQRDRLKAADIRTFFTLTDDGYARALAGVMKDAVKRAALVKAQTDFIVDNGFDGIDLDYEGFAFSDGSSSWTTTKPAWIVYIKALSTAMHAKGKLLSVTVPTGEPVARDSSTYWVYAWSEIISSIDRLRLMTYDYSWPDCSLSCSGGPIGPANWVDGVAAAAVNQVGLANAKKVWLGVTAYGYDWRISSTCIAKDANGDPYYAGQRSEKYVYAPVSKAWDAYNVAKAAGKLKALPGQSVASFKWDPVAAEYTYKYTQSDTNTVTKKPCTSTREVWFQDGPSTVARAMIAAKYQLGGVALWAFGDERDSMWTKLVDSAPSIKPFKPVVGVIAPVVIPFGTPTAVLVGVHRPDTLPVPGVNATLKWRSAAGDAWTTLGTAVTDSEGAALFTVTPQRSGEWQVTTPSTTYRQASVSPIATTKVSSTVTGVVRVRKPLGSATVSKSTAKVVTATVPRDMSTSISGRVAPVLGVQKVTLYSMSTSGVLTAVTSSSTSATGAFGFPVPTSKAGTSRYRVLVAASASHARGASLPIVITVR